MRVGPYESALFAGSNGKPTGRLRQQIPAQRVRQRFCLGERPRRVALVQFAQRGRCSHHAGAPIARRRSSFEQTIADESRG
jgi:hypothetical protein